MHDFVLYNYFRSSASYRVRIALHLKNIPFEYKAIHLINNGGEQNSAEYRKVNPAGEVPTLVHQGRTLSQSLAILQYLDDISTSPNLFPADPFAKAKVFQICEHVNSGMQPFQNLKVLQHLENEFRASADQKIRWVDHWITPGLKALEQILQETSSTFCFGGTVTAADAVVIPQLFAVRRFNITMENYPILSRIEKHCESLDYFKKAHPFRQVDTPADLKIN